MAVKRFNTRIQLKNDTSANWVTGGSLVLLKGEFAWDSTNNNFKIGNGSSSFSALNYALSIADETTIESVLGEDKFTRLRVKAIGSDKVTALTGYSLGSTTYSALAESDPLNTALAKLEAGVKAAQASAGVTAIDSKTGAFTTGSYLSSDNSNVIDIDSAKIDSTYITGQTVNTGTNLATVATVTAAIGTLDVTGYAQGSIAPASGDNPTASVITIKGIQETDGKISNDSTNDVTINVDGVYNASTNKIATQTTVSSAIDTFKSTLATSADVPVATMTDEGTELTITGSIKETNGVISDGTEADVSLYFATAPTSSNKIITQAEIADLSGAMHFRSVITTTEQSDYVSQINTYYGGQDIPAPEVGDVFVDSATGKEYVVKSVPGEGSLTASNIELFGAVDPSTVVTSLSSGTTTTGLTVSANTNATGAVTVNVNATSGYGIPTSDQLTKINNIAVNTTNKSVTDGTSTLTNIVTDANYQHVTVSATDGVTAGGVTYKYTHPTTTAAEAAAVKVGNDANGHVVLGAALTSADIATASGDPQAASNPGTTVSSSLQELATRISNASAGTLDTTNTTPVVTNASESLHGDIDLHKVAKTGTITDLYQTAPVTDGGVTNTIDLVIFDCGSATTNTNNVSA